MSGIYPPMKSSEKNEVIYYFELSDEDKQRLIDRYNKECVDKLD